MKFRRFQNVPAVIAAVLLVSCLLGLWLTRNSGQNRDAAQTAPAPTQRQPVDHRLLETARQLGSVADTPDEQTLAREALRLTDHELDQAFATALREAAAAPEPTSGPLKQMTDRVREIKNRIASEQARVARLTKEAEKSEEADDQLQLVKAQLALDADELEDAQQDLTRHGGNQHAKLQQAREEHEAAQREPPRLAKALAAPTTTLAEHFQGWLALREREEQLDAARQQAANKATALSRQHDALARIVKEKPGVYIPPAKGEGWSVVDDIFADEEDTATMVGRLRNLSEKAKTLAEMGKRIQDAQQLSDVYRRWAEVVRARQWQLGRLMLGSLAWVLTVALLAIVITQAIRRSFRLQTDRRRLNQMRVTASIAVQFVAAMVILLIIFGAPSQLSTVIGLATAGLTVALKDFIVAFFGWFALMGKHGLRVGDWVEIEGVSGEVIEIGLLRTVLLEMGNWTETGHPTGRRVAFVNSFAIEGHYFNFSTAGQWLWDELLLSLPAGGDPHQLVQQIRETVARETADDASAAERDWERVNRQYGLPPFSAKPAVDLRPSPRGLEVMVRYITRAPQRYAVKARLYEGLVDLLHRPVANPV